MMHTGSETCLMSVSILTSRVFVKIVLSLVKVAEWPPFGKKLLTRLTVCSLCNMSICDISSISYVWF